MRPSAVGRAIRHFYKTTTLHGFKYLCSRYYVDRVGWLLCCVSSACCAGVLCAVLWARFLQMPALLTLHDLRGITVQMKLPLVAVCPPAETVALLFGQKFLAGSNLTKRLPIILGNVLRKKHSSQDQLGLLEDLLYNNNTTLQRALIEVTPSCENIVLKCRWQSDIVSCERLFKKELTEWGVCCVMRPQDVNLSKGSLFETTNKLDIAVQCSDHPETINGCEFFTRFEWEEWVEPISLTPGFNYIAQMAFTSVVDKDYDKLVDGTCVSTEGYSKRECLLKCNERICGCADPIQKLTNVKVLPVCQVTQLKCLHAFKSINGNNNCKCLPSCKKMITANLLESSLMNAINETNDKIYSGLNVSTSSVLRIATRISRSRLFVVTPTETWITLLSSLGGVFNMFLGVGLFSALEVLFLLCVRLPIEIRKSIEISVVQ